MLGRMYRPQVEHLEPRLALSAQMLLDFTDTQVGLSPRGFTEFDDHVFFSTTQNEAHGLRIWRSDGTVQGTEVINALDGFEVAMMKEVNGQLIAFVQSVPRPNGHGLGEYDLFRYDGQQFRFVQEIISTEPYGPHVFDNFVVAADGRSYFTTDDGGPGGASLRSTDGESVRQETHFETAFQTLVASGTHVFAAGPRHRQLYAWDIQAKEFRLVDVQPTDEFGSLPRELTDLDGTLYFSATTATHGRELWQSDGTNIGTRMVADLQSGSASSNPTALTVLGKTLFFLVGETENSSLWKIENELTPERVVDVETNDLIRVGNRLFFTSATVFGDDQDGTDLWTLDESDQQPRLMRSFEGELQLQSINDRLFLVATTKDAKQVWYEAAKGELQLLVNLDRADAEIRSIHISSDGTLTFLIGDHVYNSDGTAAGTQLVGEFPTSPEEMIYYQDLMIYAGDSEHGTVVWATDGHSFEVIADTAWRSASSTIRFVEGPLIILQRGLDREQDYRPETPDYRFHGYLLGSDGTPQGTTRITDEPISLPEMEYCCTYTPNYELIEGNVYIRGWIHGRSWFLRVDLDQETVGGLNDHEELARVRETFASRLDEDTYEVVFETVEFEGEEYRFVGNDDIKYFFARGHLVALSNDDVRRVSLSELGIRGASGGFYQQDLGFAYFDGLVYFAANHPDSGRELWRSDGTVEGTQLVVDLNPGTSGSVAYVLGSSDDAVFFSANDGIHGLEVWAFTDPDPDINNDGIVDRNDFEILAANYGKADDEVQGDVNHDGVVDFADFLLLSYATKSGV